MRYTKLSNLLPLFVLVSLILAGCSGTPVAGGAAAAPNSVAPQVDERASIDSGKAPISESTPLPGYWVEDQPQVDEQGAVVVEIIPLNLNNPARSIDFRVNMNTHSVDLGMDLAELATLTTDTGKTVQATLWDAPLGGHHVSGKLSFPTSVDGVPLLEGIEQLSLTLTNVDAPERVFVWKK